MKNPNGYGSVVNLGKHRRNPWAVRITTGWENGKQVRRYVSYHPTKKEAMQALAQEQVNPTSPKAKMTFAELYAEWQLGAFKHLSEQTRGGHRAAYIHLKPIYNIPFTDLRTAHIQKIIDNLERSRATKNKIKSLCYQMYQYAMENDIVQKNYAQFVRLEKEEKKEKEIFTDLEIKKLFDNDNLPWVDSILIMIYTGLRIQELLNLSKFDIDLAGGTIRGGLKTDAGKNRVVPIHPKILKYVTARVNASTGLLFERNNKPLDAGYYRNYLYYPLLKQLGIARHTPHCARHTCATLLARAGANPVAIKQILGHTDYAFTVDTYTHVDKDFLAENIMKL